VPWYIPPQYGKQHTTDREAYEQLLEEMFPRLCKEVRAAMDSSLKVVPGYSCTSLHMYGVPTNL